MLVVGTGGKVLGVTKNTHVKNKNFSTIFSKVISKVKNLERITELQIYGMTERTKTIYL